MIYESVVKRLLLESKLDSLASELSRMTMKKFVSSIEDINLSPAQKEGIFVVKTKKFVSKIRNDVAVSAPKKLSLNTTVKVFHTKKDKAIAEASWDWQNNELDVKITIHSTTGNIKPQHLNIVRPSLHNTIRHELEHSSQGSELAVSSIESGYEMMQDKKDIEKKKKYYTDPSEIPAFVAGIRQQSKKERRSFYEVLEEMLQKIKGSFIGHGITDEKVIDQTINHIRNAWITYAEEAYPGVTRKFIRNIS